MAENNEPGMPQGASVDEAVVLARPHLLGLPLEMRIVIYHILFNQKIVIVEQGPNGAKLDMGNSNFAVLHTCSLLRTEALPVFYQKAVFLLQHPSLTSLLSPLIGEETTSMIWKVYIRLFEDLGESQAKALSEDFSNLKMSFMEPGLHRLDLIQNMQRNAAKKWLTGKRLVFRRLELDMTACGACTREA